MQKHFHEYSAFRWLLLRFHRPLLAKFTAQLSASYWYRKQFLQRLGLIFKKHAFIGREEVKSRWRGARIVTEISRTIAITAFEALAVLALLHLLSSALGRFPWFALLNPEPTVASNLITTLAQIAAAFLGLYFAAISVVISSAYQRVPGDVRALIAEEQVSRVYFKALTWFAAVPIVLLAALAHGIPIDALNFIFVCLLALFAVFSFVVLGVRSFHFFDPVAILPFITRNFKECVSSVTPDGYNWQTEAFQAMQRRKAEALLNSCSNLATLAAEDSRLPGRSLAEIGKSLLEILAYYDAKKGTIPPSSQWFGKRVRHKNWLLSNYNEVNIALETGTFLRAETSPHFTWVEDTITSQLERIITELAKRKDSAAALTLAEHLQGYCRTASAFGAGTEALRTLDSLHISFHQLAARASAEKTTDIPSLAIIDINGAAFIETLVGTGQMISRFQPAWIRQQAEHINWEEPTSIVSLGSIPGALATELEPLRQAMQFEYAVEKKISTPPWWCAESIAFGMAKMLKDFVSNAVMHAGKRFTELPDKASKAEHHLLLAQNFVRGLEACHKMSFYFGDWQKLWNGWKEMHCSKDRHWPELDWDRTKQQVTEFRSRLILDLSNALPKLGALTAQETVPDYFGQAYALLADECVEALFNGDHNTFANLFPPYFQASLQAHERLRKHFDGDDRNLWISTDPIIDLLTLSGYSLLADELHQMNLRGKVLDFWNAYFSAKTPEQERRIIEYFGVASKPLRLRRSPRELIRISWTQRWEQTLEQKGYSSDHDFSPRRAHPSKIIRLLASRHGMCGAHHLFLALEIYTRQNATGLVVPDDIEELQNSLKHMEESKDESP